MSLANSFSRFLSHSHAARANSNMQRFLTEITQRDGAYCTISDTRMLNLASNDYLGLATDYKFYSDFFHNETIQKILQEFGTSSSSSRLLSGTYSIIERCEKKLARLYESEAALMFSSGYHANIAVFSSLFDRHDVIFSDKLNHASIIDGIRLSRAKLYRYRHNDIEHLRNVMKAHRNEGSKAALVSETLFSMDGDCAKVKELTDAAREYDTVLILDEAHAVGVRGTRGCGLAEETHILNETDIVIGTCGKALAGSGAYIIGSNAVRDHLINTARSFIYTTAPPPLHIAWLSYVLTQLPELHNKREHLHALSQKLRNEIHAHGMKTTGDSHIIPVIAGTNENAIALSRSLRKNGFFAPAIRPPTVPAGTARIRLSLAANMSVEDVALLPSLLEKAYNEK